MNSPLYGSNSKFHLVTEFKPFGDRGRNEKQQHHETFREWHYKYIYKQIFWRKLKDLEIERFLIISQTKQRVVFDSQHYIWNNALADVPQVSILTWLLLLIFVIYNSKDLFSKTCLYSNPKLLADSKSLFVKVHNANEARNIFSWSNQNKWFNFNPDISKQAHEVAFLRKTFKVNHR